MSEQPEFVDPEESVEQIDPGPDPLDEDAAVADDLP
jgi:hypothetical protein